MIEPPNRLPQVTPDPSTAAAGPPRRRGRFLRRLFLVTLGLLLLAAAAHRPLLHGVIRWAVPRWAAGQGVQVELETAGSIWSDVALHGVTVRGLGDSGLPVLDLEQVEVDYDLGALWRGEWEAGVEALRLRAAELRLDLREPLPWAKGGAPAAKKAPSGEAPPLVWPVAIEIDGVNAEVTLADGAQVRVTGLRLRQPVTGTGELAWSELAWVPASAGSAAVLFPPVRARLEKTGRRLRLTGLDLPYQARLESLELDLTGYADGVLGLVAEVARAGARLGMDITARQVFAGPLSVAVASQLTGVRESDVAGLPLPEGWSFESLGWALEARGEPANWPAMTARVELTAEGLQVAGQARVEALRVPLRWENRRLTVEDALARQGENELRLNATAEPGPAGQELAQARWQASLKAALPQVEAWLARPGNLGGAVRGEAEAQGLGARVETAALSLNGSALALSGYRLPEARVEAALEGDQLRVALRESALGEGNTVAAEAVVRLGETLPVEASWRLRVESVARLLEVTGLPAPPHPVSASVGLEGTAKGELTALLAGDFSQAQAEAKLVGRELRLAAKMEAEPPVRLEAVELEARLADGVVRVPRGLLRVDAENEVSLSGQAALAGARAFALEARAKLPRLGTLEPVLRPFLARLPTAGELELEARARGELSPWQCDGRVKLAAREVAVTGVPERVSAQAEAVFAGTQAEIGAMTVSAGPWSASLRAAAGPDAVTVEDLRVRWQQTVLAEGRVRYPWTWLKPGSAEALALDLRVKELALAELLGAMGMGGKGVPAGKLQAEAKLEGTLETLAGDVTASFAGSAPLMKGLAAPPSLTTRAALAQGQLQWTAELRQAPLETLTVEAALPLTLAEVLARPAWLMEQPLKARVRLPESDLSTLAGLTGGTVRELPARLRLEADVTGTLASPRWLGELDLTCPEVVLANPDLPSVRDVKLRLRARDQEALLEDLSLLLAGGRLHVRGRTGLENLANPTLDLTATASEALVFRDAQTSLRADADLRVVGPLKAARLSGQIQLVRGRYYKNIDLAPALRLPSDAPALPPDPERARTQLELPALVKDWQFAVDVTTRDPVLLSGNLINGAVSVRAALGGTGAAPLLTGGAKVDRLLLKLPFSLVKVTFGEVKLRPERPWDPQVDMRAESRLPSHQITLFANGPVSNIQTRFSSTPPLSEADIASLLATGTTLSGDGTSVAAEAIVRGLYLYASELFRKTFKRKKTIDETPPRFHFGFAPSGVGADRAVDAMQATYDFNDHWRMSGQFAPSGRVRAALGYLIRFGKTRSNPPLQTPPAEEVKP